MAVDLDQSVIANLLHEFAGPLGEQSGVGIVVELSDVGGGKVTMAKYKAEFLLTSSITVPVPEIALRHAGDTQAFLEELIEESLKPFGERVRRAANAAVTSWEAALANGG